ncbi:DNA-directed RNA polymerase subunit K [Methanococcus maripaludis]|uniref:DNA-directed RNA polymerase subunit K n=1 Tax=Methanococcus maripaludis TaxID=39152 RepID=A0A7J9NHA2_METMI|nr:DNA-directed RNA polymerase subunit K [Methanococcus maripaludis]MBA2839890.1 DNA-directed RNA polymerase subunit K [Methanococcus maripaludis]MBA2852467.1 DNA-directed RNA polymerase subunit K [Methanococcus maripaludis]MBA2859608.1 DNA-directed RNA polymerase subunit K [Methanococcus maripaludis]MBA2868245.1 DNA-directed RNA polymerase subunit K [Methanococcus maripaludis]MBB6401181.1 DNA-directed RNA polymerase subunit K [Methanococcus maripaludis]
MKLTKFETARLIGARSLQISDGAPLAIESEKTSSLDLADEEVKQGKLPLCVKKQAKN